MLHTSSIFIRLNNDDCKNKLVMNVVGNNKLMAISHRLHSEMPKLTASTDNIIPMCYPICYLLPICYLVNGIMLSVPQDIRNLGMYVLSMGL